MKDFNKESRRGEAPQKPVPYSEARGDLRAEMDRLIEAIKADPFNFKVALTFGDEPLAKLERAKERLSPDIHVLPPSRKEAEDITTQAQAALREIDIHLGASGEILRLYTTRYMPMTHGGCVDVGAMIKEDFDKRIAVLSAAAEAGHSMLADLRTWASQLGEDEKKHTSDDIHKALKKKAAQFKPPPLKE